MATSRGFYSVRCNTETPIVSNQHILKGMLSYNCQTHGYAQLQLSRVCSVTIDEHSVVSTGRFDCFESSWSLLLGRCFACAFNLVPCLFSMPRKLAKLIFWVPIFRQHCVWSAGHPWRLQELSKLVPSGCENVGEHSARSTDRFSMLQGLVTGLDLISVQET